MKTSTSRTLFEADSVASSLRVSTLAAIGQRGLGLIRGIALAALMPMDEYGLLGVAILVANLLMPACSAGLYDGMAGEKLFM